MDAETLKVVIQLGQFLVTCAIGFYVHLVTKDKVTNERISKLEEDLDSKLEGHAERVARLEEASKQAPNHADLAKVYESVNSLSATVNQLVGENRGQSDTLRLILNQITQKGMA